VSGLQQRSAQAKQYKVRSQTLNDIDKAALLQQQFLLTDPWTPLCFHKKQHKQQGRATAPQSLHRWFDLDIRQFDS
jgi:hypothetical protein